MSVPVIRSKRVLSGGGLVGVAAVVPPLAWRLRGARGYAGGLAAGVGVAWLLAWPLTQISLLCWPQVGHAVGLSGLMHAGTLLLAVQIALARIPIRGARFWGLLLIWGVLTKVVLERGWSHPLVWDAGQQLWVVQAAHVTGAFWGVVLGLMVAALPGARRATAR
mgnify:CR=1 FL=1